MAFRGHHLTCHATHRTQLSFRLHQARSLLPMPRTGSGGIHLCLPRSEDCTLKMGTSTKNPIIKAARYSRLHSFRVVVVSNQAGISLKPDAKGPRANMSKLTTFKTKVLAVFGQLDIPISIYAATGKDIYRKPRTGMWTELLDDYGMSPENLDLENSIFVGDAAGREALNSQPKDFSCSDRFVSFSDIMCGMH